MTKVKLENYKIQLKKVFPTHQILAEETANKTAKPASKGYRWIIDPLGNGSVIGGM